MKIVVKRNEQQPEVTIDLKDSVYSYIIRDAFRLALEIDGFSKETISEIFYNADQSKCE